MLLNNKIPPHLQACADVRKETFAALMDLYENNFLRIKKLVPQLKQADGEMVSLVVGCLDLQLTILEQSKFTTLLTLTYSFERKHGQVREPNLLIRVYHDVGLAEVLCGELHHGRLRLHNVPDTAIMERWHLNRFLYKWLGFSLHIGHGFGDENNANCIKNQINSILSEKL